MRTRDTWTPDEKRAYWRAQYHKHKHQLAYRRANRDRLNAYAREYNAKNRKRVSARNHERYNNDPAYREHVQEVARERRRKLSALRPPKPPRPIIYGSTAEKARAYYQANRDKLRAKARAYYAEHREEQRARKRREYAAKKGRT